MTGGWKDYGQGCLLRRVIVQLNAGEVAALMEMSRRAPKTVAEQLWFDELLKRIDQAYEQAKRPPTGPEPSQPTP